MIETNFGRMTLNFAAKFDKNEFREKTFLPEEDSFIDLKK